MVSVAVFQSGDQFDPLCSDFIAMAERELSAFFNTVTQLFGPRQAEASAEDWLSELGKLDVLPGSCRDWRLLTARASTRLADRVSANVLQA